MKRRSRPLTPGWTSCLIFVASAGVYGCAGDNPEDSGEAPPDTAAMAGTTAGAGRGGAGGRASQGATDMPAAGAGGGDDAADAAVPPAGPPPGVFMPRPAPDPNAVFEWPETLPGGGDTCQPGTYTGTFMCTLNAGTFLGVPPPPDGAGVVIVGPVTLTFARSMDGEFLELTDGRLEGLALASWGFVAELEGRLDCTTLEFTARATSGLYGLGLPIGIPSGTFGGTLSGSLDRQTVQLSGRWELLDDLGTRGCDGPWMASFTP